MFIVRPDKKIVHSALFFEWHFKKLIIKSKLLIPVCIGNFLRKFTLALFFCDKLFCMTNILFFFKKEHMFLNAALIEQDARKINTNIR